MDMKMMNPFKYGCVVNGDDFYWGYQAGRMRQIDGDFGIKLTCEFLWIAKSAAFLLYY